MLLTVNGANAIQFPPQKSKLLLNMNTTTKLKQYKAIGHRLKPIVTIGDKGLSDSVLEELSRALNDHELIKIKLAGVEGADRKLAAEKVSTAVQAELIQVVGKTALLLRPAAKPNPKLSNLIRPA